jgi:hypothetical protein
MFVTIVVVTFIFYSQREYINIIMGRHITNENERHYQECLFQSMIIYALSCFFLLLLYYWMKWDQMKETNAKKERQRLISSPTAIFGKMD